MFRKNEDETQIKPIQRHLFREKNKAIAIDLDLVCFSSCLKKKNKRITKQCCKKKRKKHFTVE